MMENLNLVLAALSPVDRWNALRPEGADGGGAGTAFSWTVWVPVIVAVVVGIGLILAYRRWTEQREAVRSFLDTADRLGLEKHERTLLGRIARLVGGRNLSVVFTSQDAYERGVAALVGSEAVGQLDAAGRQRVMQTVESLRVKLGYAIDADFYGPEAESAGHLHPHSRVTIDWFGERPAVDGVVVATRGRELAVRPNRAIDYAPGESVVVRWVSEGTQWEWSAVVMGETEEHDLSVRSIGEPRSVNLRRFVRVPTRKAAHVARFPFVREDGKALPEFVEGTVTEIAGPGLRIDIDLDCTVGERVLVAMRAGPGRYIQGQGRVRRAVRGDDGMAVVVVELQGLTDGEVAELVRETNAVARQAKEHSEPKAEPAAAAAGGRRA